jgi:hypothetical protein
MKRILASLVFLTTLGVFAYAAFGLVSCAQPSPEATKAMTEDAGFTHVLNAGETLSNAPAGKIQFASSVGGGSAPGLPTYSVSDLGVSPIAAPTDFLCINGSSTKTITVLHVEVSGATTATTADKQPVSLIVRSSADTWDAGATTSYTGVPHDSTSPAATATVLRTSAGSNPSQGASVGNVRQDYFSPLPTGASTINQATRLSWDFVAGLGVVLRGTAQGMCINLSTIIQAGGAINFGITWTEQ